MTLPFSNARTGGKILVDQLLIHGADMAFCVPGESYLEVLDALFDVRDRFKLVNARHEAGAANMAEAYGKLTGKPGICMVTRGPGACHAAVGVHTAFQDSTPMIMLIGQVGRDMMDREAFQEIDYRQMFGPVAKWAAQIDVTARIPEYIARAFHIATSGRPGPVVLALPEDMLTEVTQSGDAVRYHATQPAARGAGLRANSRTARWREEADDPGRRSRLERPRLRPIAGFCRGQRHSGRDLVPPAGYFRQPVVMLRRRSRHVRAARSGAALQGSRPAVRDRRAPRRNDHPGLHHSFGADGPTETDPCPRRRQRTRKGVHARHRRAVVCRQFHGWPRRCQLVRRGPLERLAQMPPAPIISTRSQRPTAPRRWTSPPR